MSSRALLATVLACAGLACATPSPTPPAATAPDDLAKPAVECRTVLEVRPGSFGTAGSATPVQQCEPVGAPAESAPATDEETPLGTPIAP